MASQGPTKTIYICPDEWTIVLEALHAYKTTNDGRKVAGRINWLQAKFQDCKKEDCQIRFSA